MIDDTILEIEGITKRYGHITAVDSLSLTLERGTILGILGPNGSGKTTTLGIVLDILNADEGNYRWFGGSVSNTAARKRVGSLLETPNFYPYLDADENLEIVSHIKGVKQSKFDDILNTVNLLKRRKSPFSSYSLGMKQRLAIASALIGDPDVLIFDEPTNGLDPQGIAEVRDTIREIGESGKTILMASHILYEVEKVCSHVAILKNGKLLVTGSVGAIMDQQLEVKIAAADMNKLRHFLSSLPFVQNLQDRGDLLYFEMDPSHDISEVNKKAFENGITLNHLVATGRSLEDEFLKITA